MAIGAMDTVCIDGILDTYICGQGQARGRKGWVRLRKRKPAVQQRGRRAGMELHRNTGACQDDDWGFLANGQRTALRHGASAHSDYMQSWCHCGPIRQSQLWAAAYALPMHVLGVVCQLASDSTPPRR